MRAPWRRTAARARVLACVALLSAGATTCPADAAAPPLPPVPETVPLPPIPPNSFDTTPALPPYQAKLDRLAELIGTLAYLRDLCGKHDGAVWRDKMDALLSAEGTVPTRRDRLAGSYNRAYADYQMIYRSCTPAAETIMARATREGARLVADVANRFGTP